MAGLRLPCRQFSTPGGIPSHVSVPTPGSIHEGGELGYVLVHAFGAAFDNPDLIVAAVVGDGEAETGPLAGAWKGTSFLNPARDGAVLPILHLNGYKITGPTVLGRDSDDDVRRLLAGQRLRGPLRRGRRPARVHQAFAATLDRCYDRIRAIQQEARAARRLRAAALAGHRPAHAEGLDGPEGGGRPPGRGHLPLPPGAAGRRPQQPGAPGAARGVDAHLRAGGAVRRRRQLVAELAALAPRGDRRMSANPHANGGKLLVDLDLPDFRDYAVEVERPAVVRGSPPAQLGKMLRDVYVRNAEAANFRLFCPDETNSNRLGNVFEVENRCFVGRTLDIDDHVSPDGRVMEVLSEHLCEGWLEGYLLTGRHGLFATYEAFAMVSASMTVQHTEVAAGGDEPAVAGAGRVAQHPAHLDLLAQRPQRLQPPGPGLIDVMLSKRGTVARIYLPPDANCLLSVADHCLRSRNYVNLIVIDKQPQLQYLDMDTAIEHCAQGRRSGDWASNDDGGEPDVVLGCAGDIPTLETVAAAWYLRQLVPDLRCAWSTWST